MLPTFDHIIQNLPCQVDTLSISGQKPDPYADNSDDYHGYVDIDFRLLDPKGQPAVWLEQLMTKEEREKVEKLILQHLAESEKL